MTMSGEPAPPCPECGAHPLYRGHCGLCGYDAPLPERSVLSAEETIERLAWELIDKVGIPDLPLALAVAKVAAAVERARCREELAAMMLRQSIATGHGDTFDDLLRELEAGIARLDRLVIQAVTVATPSIRDDALEEAARVADGYCTERTDDVARGIRALKDSR